MDEATSWKALGGMPSHDYQSSEEILKMDEEEIA